MNRKPLATGLLFAALTIGYGIVHGVVTLWASSLIQPFWQAASVHESLQVDKHGQVFIARSTSMPGSEFDRLDVFDLQGQEISETELSANTVYGRSISPSPQLKRPLPAPDSWQECLIPMQDFGTPSNYWYLIAP